VKFNGSDKRRVRRPGAGASAARWGIARGDLADRSGYSTNIHLPDR
jgi:hypothetical protein